MFVAVARVTLQIPDSGSLKAKRQILRRVTDRVKARFNVSVAEVDENDRWQRAVIGLCVVGNDRRHVNEQMDKILHFVEEMYVAPVTDRQLEIVSFGDRLQALELAPEAADGEDEEADPQEELSFEIPKGDRSLAEAEGIAWEDRHQGGAKPESGKRGTARPQGRSGERLSLEEARAKARSLRNLRDWEKK